MSRVAITMTGTALLPLDRMGTESPQQNLGRSAELEVILMSSSGEQEIIKLSKVIRQRKHDADLYHHRGSAYHRINENQKALQDYDSAISLDPSFAVAYRNRAVAYAALYERLRESQKAKLDNETVIGFLSRALTADPTESRLYCFRGAACNFSGQLEQALDDLNVALRLDPGYGKSFRDRGEVFCKLGRFAEAQADLSTALSLDPQNPIILGLLENLRKRKQ